MSRQWWQPLVAAGWGTVRGLGAAARGLALDAVNAAAHLAEWTQQRGGAGTATVHVAVVILADERGRPVATAEQLQPALRRAQRIFADHADIRIVVDGIRTADEAAPTRALDARANRMLLLDHLLGRTGTYRRYLPPRPLLSVVGDPITVVVVRSLSGRVTGSSLGMTADWVLCQASLFDADQPRRYDETVLAHELAHAMNLPHLRDRTNLMYPSSTPPDRIRGTELRPWQAAVLRSNRHVVPARGRPPVVAAAGGESLL